MRLKTIITIIKSIHLTYTYFLLSSSMPWISSDRIYQAPKNSFCFVQMYSLKKGGGRLQPLILKQMALLEQMHTAISEMVLGSMSAPVWPTLGWKEIYGKGGGWSLPGSPKTGLQVFSWVFSGSLTSVSPFSRRASALLGRESISKPD